MASKLFQIFRLENNQITLKEFIKLFENLFGKNLEVYLIKNNLSETMGFDPFELKTYLFNEFWLIYQLKISEIGIYGNGIFENIERKSTLINIDLIWQEHLQKITLLRDAVRWRGYGQKNPLTEYKREAYLLFAERKEALTYFTLYDLLRSTIV
jgi:preprotein translocase subunit SecA